MPEASPRIYRERIRSLTGLALVAVGATLSGCAAVNSTSGAGTSSGGLIYYMPKRDILVTVTNANAKLTSITATASTPYADRRKAYKLDYQPHLLAKNTMDLDVSEAGLLTSTKANLTGDAVAALGGLGTLGGYLRGAGIGIQSATASAVEAKSAASGCKLDGAHTFLFPAAPGEFTICDGFRVSITRLGWDPDQRPEPQSTLVDGTVYSGVFYRSNLPYKVAISTEGLNAEVIVHSPSESTPQFLPVARTVFANNDAAITLSHGAGVPSKYVQNTDGEAAALLKLPAAIAAPYFAAIGQVFTWRRDQRTAQSADMTSATNLELAKIKYQKCLDAIEAKDTELIASLRCAGN